MTTDSFHHILVDRADLGLFSHLRGPRTEITTKEDVMPSGIMRVPHTSTWVSRWKLRPLSGWLVQQIAKLASAATIDADVLVMIDSDTALIQPLDTSALTRDGRVRLYRAPGAITSELPDHLLWHGNACSLLGVAPEGPPLPDYISSLVTWDRTLVTRMLARIEETTAMPWHRAIAKTRRVSEFVLYGTYVDGVLGDDAAVWHDDDDLCLTWWSFDPLTAADVDAFVGDVSDRDVAVLVSSHSHTSPEVLSSIRSRLSSGRLD